MDWEQQIPAREIIRRYKELGGKHHHTLAPMPTNPTIWPMNSTEQQN